ncbi:hypothetical protein [Duganella sp. LjRoot269]|uniref:hypothetical protein n=1 Tax=Duganella sp. LjRoot269 TaxID=3342305 RepID=UPI003ECE7E68
MSEQPTDRAAFAWRNGPGEIASTKFEDQVLRYWRNVALPALASADIEVEQALAATETDVSAVFVHTDRVDQHQVTALAMGIALQSLWERQLRRYLGACVASDEAMQKRVQKVPWTDLQKLFHLLRGVPLQAFANFPELDLLSQIGNVCRHGDGTTADRLWKSHPELWPYSENLGQHGAAPPVEHIHLSTEMLTRLADAVATFWEFISYLYTENLRVKHPSVERRLPELRRRHVWAIEHFNLACLRDLGEFRGAP